MMKPLSPARSGWLLACLTLLILTGLSACDKADSSTVAGNLEDRLTEALNFDDGEKVPGDPPPENPGEEHPQIAGIQAPSTLSPGDSFEVQVFPELGGNTDISQVAIFVRGADGHIRVAASWSPHDNGVTLRGKLERAPNIAGDFSISVALLREDGESGQAHTWDLNVPDTSDRDGDSIIEYPIGYSCALDTFQCSDAELMQYVTAFSTIGNCSNDCQSLLNPDLPEEVTDFEICHACCLEESLGGLDERTFVECQACLIEMGRSEEGEEPNPEESRASSRSDWEDIQDVIRVCGAVSLRR